MYTHEKKPPWQKYSHSDDDPLTGFVNIMDVMLVFALGLMLTLISQSRELKEYFKLEQAIEVEAGSELVESPEVLQKLQRSGQAGMESLGQVYRDPKTGKLILIEVSGHAEE